MEQEEMKRILIQGLEYWNEALTRERGISGTYNTFVAQIVGRNVPQLVTFREKPIIGCIVANHALRLNCQMV